MKVWVDISAPAHVLVFRPLIALLRERGDEVEVTTRDYAQTLELLERHGIEPRSIGAHGGRSRVAKAFALSSRLRALKRYAKGRGYDLALAHGSHELTITARRLGIPSATTHDYEYATLQHHLGDRAATKVVVPEAIPEERMARFGVRPPKLLQYPGLKEEYYLYDFEPDPDASSTSCSSTGSEHSSSCARRPTSRSTTGARTRSSRACSTYLGRESDVHAVVLPRSPEQRDYVRSLEPAVADRPRPRRGRAEPDRARRPRRLGRRDDEPRGGGARSARVHDVRRPARRRRRDAPARGAAAAADRPAGARARKRGRARRSASGATRRSCSTCCSQLALARLAPRLP